MDPRLDTIATNLVRLICSKCIVKVKQGERRVENGSTIISLNPIDYTRFTDHTFSIRLLIKGRTLHYTLAVTGERFEQLLPEIKKFLKAEKVARKSSGKEK